MISLAAQCGNVLPDNFTSKVTFVFQTYVFHFVAILLHLWP